MSSRSPPSQGEDEELSLSLEFQGLQISIKGNADKAASFVQRLAVDSGRASSSAGPGGAYIDLPRQPAPSSAPSIASWQEVEAATPPRRRVETRDSIEASFPQAPRHIRLLASSLSVSAGGWTPEQRIQRAWTAGNWAGAVRAGRVQSPNRTPVLDLGNRYYAVVRGPGISSPKVYRTSRELFGAVGTLEANKPFATASHRRQKPRCTLLEQDLRTCTSLNRDNGSQCHVRSSGGRGHLPPARRLRACHVPALRVGSPRPWFWVGKRFSVFGLRGAAEERWCPFGTARIGYARRCPSCRRYSNPIGFGGTPFEDRGGSCLVGRSFNFAGAYSCRGPFHTHRAGGLQCRSDAVFEVSRTFKRTVRSSGLRLQGAFVDPSPGCASCASPRVGQRRSRGCGGPHSVLLGRRCSRDTWSPGRRTSYTGGAAEGRPAPGRQAKTSHSSSWKRSLTSCGKEKADSCSFSSVPGGDLSDPSGFGFTGAEPLRQNSCDGSYDLHGGRPYVSIEKAHWQLSLAWIHRCLTIEESGPGNASSQGDDACKASGDFQPERHGGDGPRFARGTLGLCEGNVGAISGSYCLGGTDCKWRRGPLSRPGLSHGLDVLQGLTGENQTPSRTCSSQRNLLHQCSAEHVEADVSRPVGGGGGLSPERQRSHSNTVFGEVWRFWPYSGHWLHHLAGGAGSEPHAGGEFPSCKGRLGSSLRMFGADSNGQWQDGSWSAPGSGGGPTPQPVQWEVRCGGGQSEALRPYSESEMGHDSASVPERDGCHQHKKGRGDFFRKDGYHRRKQCCPWAKEEGKRQGRTKSEGLPACPSAGGGVGGLSSGDEQALSGEITFENFSGAFIRWILRSRTSFGAFLARTFHARRLDSDPATAVFPLPVPCIGIFEKQRSPKLSKAMWRRVCRKRALHVLVMALNYVHNGLRPVAPALLGRRPSLAQLSVFRRLQALLAACDQPGARYALPPGRSGFEFIAKLVELEKYSGSHPAFNLHYGGPMPEPHGCDEVVGKISKEHYFEVTEEFSPMQPYRSLIASRLKLSGTGAWDLQKHLDSILWLPFQDPGILLHSYDIGNVGPSFKFEKLEENLELVKIWDSRGLLALFPSGHATGLARRVFNAHKNSEVDRQIGDRRWFNASECHPRGPSTFLPSGHLMTSLHCPRGRKLVGCAADRKDFYHQAKVSRERAHTNVLPFEFEAEHVRRLAAWEGMIEAGSKRFSREVHGDRLGQTAYKPLREEDVKKVTCGFSSLFQGDHLGVEFALESHTALLQDEGLLREGQTVLGHHPFPRGPIWQRLVIDDYFAISCEAASSDPLASASVGLLQRAEDAYSREEVFGSDDKTVRGAESFKVIGAEILSDQKARDSGLVSVGAPLSKRLPMAALSFRAATLPVISRTLASRLAGNWVSVMMFRRCLSCILSRIFALGNKTESDANEVLSLSRATAEELVLAGIFGLIAISDISVPYDAHIYATDASNQKGAITALQVESELSQILWLGGDKRGAYTMLDSPQRSMLRSLGEDLDDAPLLSEVMPSPAKMIPFEFDFVEIFGGSGVLSAAVAGLGLRVCPPIDLSRSPHHDIGNQKLLNWIFQMISEKRFRSLICEPPCTTFSPAQHPASRSYRQPLGFNRKDPKTALGNLLAFRSFLILWFAYRWDTPAMLETPYLSKMAWLPSWKFLLEPGFVEAVLNSCALGSIHKKPFRLLGWGLDMEMLNVPCPKSHEHVRIEGKLTKPSAIYHQGVADLIARRFHLAVTSSKAEDAERSAPRLESIVINDLLLRDGWKTLASWCWSKPGHINVLESRAFVTLERMLLEKGGDLRFNILLDSRVAKGAHAKGRSAAYSLRPSLLRSCAYQIAGNLHPAYGFAPTRLNTADAPSRDKEALPGAKFSVVSALNFEEVATVHSHQFSRAAGNWIRLYLLVCICSCPGVAASSVDFSPKHAHFLGMWILILALILATCLTASIFGSHHSPGFRAGLPMSWTCSSLGRWKSRGPPFWVWDTSQLHTVAFWGVFRSAAAMPMGPSNKDEEQRAQRREGTILQADRVVLQSTRNRRDQYLLAFDRWLSENVRITLECLLEPRSLDADYISELLVAYGKELYVSGKSYNRFSETINAVSARRPVLRRQMAACWDLAFNWVVDEPHEHNKALPQSILLAAVGLALLWGWSREAAILALGWTGVLRIGEIFQAKREDLILPRDAAPGTWFALLKIKLPKTRGRAARHQSSRIDPRDVVLLLDGVFSRLLPSEPLWNRSPQALRKRFSALQTALGLVGGGESASPPYSLSSLRPGGATYWLQTTEDAEYVRRKGRWLSTRVLEVYLQESTFATYTQSMTLEAQSRVSSLVVHFNDILLKALQMLQFRIPEHAWPRLW